MLIVISHNRGITVHTHLQTIDHSPRYRRMNNVLKEPVQEGIDNGSEEQNNL